MAYATLLSTRPKACVGGVKTRNQFYKVCVSIILLQKMSHKKGPCLMSPTTLVVLMPKEYQLLVVQYLYVRTSFLNFNLVNIYQKQEFPCRCEIDMEIQNIDRKIRKTIALSVYWQYKIDRNRKFSCRWVNFSCYSALRKGFLLIVSESMSKPSLLRSLQCPLFDRH